MKSEYFDFRLLKQISCPTVKVGLPKVPFPWQWDILAHLDVGTCYFWLPAFLHYRRAVNRDHKAERKFAEQVSEKPMEQDFRIWKVHLFCSNKYFDFKPETVDFSLGRWRNIFWPAALCSIELHCCFRASSFTFWLLVIAVWSQPYWLIV